MTRENTLAAELYALENQRPLDSVQSTRWRELAATLFGPGKPVDKRGSPRVKGQAQVLVGVEAIDVVDVSWQGMLVSSDTLGASVAITALRSEDGEWQQVELHCKTVRTSRGTLLVLTENEPKKRHDFFVHAYYPLYLAHLRQLAAA